MLFRKKYQAHANTAPTASAWRGGQIVCVKRDFWRRLRLPPLPLFTPLKPVPPRRKAVDFSKYDQEDFSLSFHGICWKAEW